MKYNFDHVSDRRSTYSEKWNVKNNELPMWVADMDFDILPDIKEALHNVIDNGTLGYTFIPDTYFESYVSWWKEKHNLTLKKEWMIFSNGVVSSLDSMVRALTKPNDYVLIMTPVYNCFFSVIKNNGRRLLNIELIIKDGRYVIDFEDLEKKIIEFKPSLFILCNPHNPVGRVWTKEELMKVSEICHKHNVQIISDEIHCDIVRTNVEFVPMMSVDPTVITCLSPTKAFSIAGVQTSAVVVQDKDIHDKLQASFYADDIGEANAFAVDATIAAFSKGQEYNKELNEYIDKNIQEVNSFLKERLPRIGYISPEGTYLLWLDVSCYADNIDEFTSNLRKETGLYLASGSKYGSNTHVRMNVATSLDNVKDGLKRLEQYIKKLEAK